MLVPFRDAMPLVVKHHHVERLGSPGHFPPNLAEPHETQCFSAQLGDMTEPEPEGSGSAVVDVQISALSAADVARLVVTVTGEGISPTIVAELPEGPDDVWSGTIEGIPAGTDRTFTAEAFNPSDELIYAGSATGVTIENSVTTSVTIYLQQVDPISHVLLTLISVTTALAIFPYCRT